jgi:hypothetical protein
MLPPYIIAYIRKDHNPRFVWQMPLPPEPPQAIYVDQKDITVKPLKPQISPVNAMDPEEKLFLALKQKGECEHSRRHSNRRPPNSCICGCGARPNRKRHFVSGHNQVNGKQFRGEA